MPELPDVERNRRIVERHMVGTRIERVEATDPTVLRNSTIKRANALLGGCLVTSAERAGKWLTVRTDRPLVLFHFGMTGSLRWEAASADHARFDRLTFATAAGELRFNDMRKLQGIWLAHDDDEAVQIVGPQGPDALEIAASTFAEIGRRRSTIKAALIDQRVIAGLGNMLSDEVLWRASIHPSRPARSLTDEEITHLHRVLRSTLRAAVRAGRIPRSHAWLTGQRDRDEPICPRCHQPLERTRVAGRMSLWCPHEQRR